MHGPRPEYQVKADFTQRSAKIHFLGCETCPHAQRQDTQPSINILGDLCTCISKKNFFSDKTPKCQLASLGEVEFLEKVAQMQDKKWESKEKMDAVVIVLIILACSVPLCFIVHFIDNKIKELLYIYRINRNIKYRILRE